MAGVSIAIQANPDVSSIIVGATRIVIDLAVGFVTYVYSPSSPASAQFFKGEEQYELSLRLGFVC